MVSFKRINRIHILMVFSLIQSSPLLTANATATATVTDIDASKLSAYYEGVAHTLQFSSRLMVTMKLMNNPEHKTLAFQSLFLAAGTESNKRINDLGENAERYYKEGIIETTQLWVMGQYPICLPMSKSLSASDIENAINEGFEGPFEQDSLAIFIVGAMHKLSIQYPCKKARYP